jgi:hypothetical protein
VSDSDAGREPVVRGAPVAPPRRKGRFPDRTTHEALIADLDAQARVRRKLSERMAFELAFPPGRRVGSISELIRAKSMYVKYGSTDEVFLAFPAAPGLVRLGSERQAGFFEGPGGLVLYFHDLDELWDMVVPVRPFQDFVLLGVEDVEDVFFLVTPDSAKAISAFSELEDALTAALRSRAEMAKDGLVPPLHQGYSAAVSSS